MLKRLLSQSSYWIINKDLTLELGIETSLLLTHLIDCADMLNQPFYQQKEKIKETTGISERQWRKSMKILQDRNILTVVKRGNPAKNYYTIVEETIVDIINSALTSEAQMSLTSEAQMSPSSDAQMSLTKKVIKTNNQKKKKSQGVEGETTPEGLSVTSSTPDSKRRKGGFDKMMEIYPENKQKDIINGECIWNELSQSEKQEVMRHVVVYVKNTEPQFVKQIGKYMEARLWEGMKPKMNEKQKLENLGFEVIDCQSKNEYNSKDDDWLSAFEEITVK